MESDQIQNSLAKPIKHQFHHRDMRRIIPIELPLQVGSRINCTAAARPAACPEFRLPRAGNGLV